MLSILPINKICLPIPCIAQIWSHNKSESDIGTSCGGKIDTHDQAHQENNSWVKGQEMKPLQVTTAISRAFGLMTELPLAVGLLASWLPRSTRTILYVPVATEMLVDDQFEESCV
jgi:hypothetical protein